MNDLWRELVDLLRRKPILWVPVLVADLVGYGINQGRVAALRAIVLNRMVQHSALGGAVVHTQMTASQMQSTTALALVLSWASYFLRLMVYSGAFVLTANMVWQLARGRNELPEQTATKAKPGLSAAFELALRALVVYVLAALFLSTGSAMLAKYGAVAVLQSAWLGVLLTLIVLLVLSIWLAPLAIRLLTGRPPEKRVAGEAQQFAATMAIVVAALSAIVGSNSLELARTKVAVRYPLEIVGSLVVALPYVFLFVGMALIARRASRFAGE